MTISAPTRFPITAGIEEMQMKVPFLHLNAHHEPFLDEFTSAIQEVVEIGAFAGGPFVERFEKQFAAYCGSKYAIGVCNGTDALWLTLLALGVGEGDEGSTRRSLGGCH